jgi:hypothetical protein
LIEEEDEEESIIKELKGHQLHLEITIVRGFPLGCCDHNTLCVIVVTTT